MEIDIEALPIGPEEHSPVGIETVVLAETVRPRAGRRVEVVEVKREEGRSEVVILDEIEVAELDKEVSIKSEPED